jgi:hypothetical protein
VSDEPAQARKLTLDFLYISVRGHPKLIARLIYPGLILRFRQLDRPRHTFDHPRSDKNVTLLTVGRSLMADGAAREITAAPFDFGGSTRTVIRSLNVFALA